MSESGHGTQTEEREKEKREEDFAINGLIVCYKSAIAADAIKASGRKL